jgi:5-(carboxyamino)imidazole ribonucleotide synthase
MILPGSRIGIVGGGQLARMSGLAARAMGYGVAVADPDPDCPASAVADRVVRAALDDPEALATLAPLCAVITYEWENIGPSALQRLEAILPVRPGPHLLSVSQHRIREKSALAEIGVPVAPWRPVNDRAEFEAAVAAVGLPSVLKTATGGYDGKGQAVIRDRSEAEAAFGRLAGRPLILEQFVPFACEVSVLVARNERGETAAFPTAENIHRENILALSIVPARIAAETDAAARALAVRIAERLDLVGLLGVEMFALPDGSLLVNELAPRPHNSGHYTMDACVTSQFEQHIRAVCGLPLGSTALLSPVVMVNIMGEDYPLDPAAALRDPHVKLHLYGKREPRPHRKMGHLNVLGASAEEALARAQEARRRIAGGRSRSGI